MNNERTQLLEQANELGLEFQSNIPSDKLQAMIDEALNESDKVVKAPPAPRGRKRMREIIAESKKRALRKHVVTITNKDNRENDVMTTVPLSFENAYFGISRKVPLDIPVEIEEALLDIAESTMMTLHKDEIKNGQRTGNKIPVSVKKFAISYAKPE